MRGSSVATQFKKGNTASKGVGNGRPAGSKNKATIYKEAVLQKAEAKLLRNLNRIVDKTLELADGGDTACLKILWDRIIPVKSFGDKERGNTSISITIEGMEKNITVEGEYSEEP